MKGCGCLRLNLGEPILIKAEFRDWFFVKNIENDEEGIVPKSYVYIRDCSVVSNP
jgi:hypothetical protein